MFDFRPSRPLRIASLVKQIPKFEEMELSPDGRLVRAGVELHMNDYCRRAVRTGCELALASEGTCTAITLGRRRPIRYCGKPFCADVLGVST